MHQVNGAEASRAGAMKVLIVDDRADDADLVVAALEDAGMEVSFERVDSEARMLDALARETWDVVLTDHVMPGFDSTRALAALATLEFPPPGIVVSGAIGEEATVRLMRAGAADFVPKDSLARLPAAIQRARTRPRGSGSARVSMPN